MLNYRWLIGSGVGLFFSLQSAQAQPVPNLTSAQLQRFERDLTSTNAQDFFKQGKAQFEQEIRSLEQGRVSSDQPTLKIDPTLQDVEHFQPASSQSSPPQPLRTKSD